MKQPQPAPTEEPLDRNLQLRITRSMEKWIDEEAARCGADRATFVRQLLQHARDPEAFKVFQNKEGA